MIGFAVTVLSLVLFGISGRFKSVCDTLAHHFDGSRYDSCEMDEQFWNPRYSWSSKYKNGDPKQGPKFFGSTTFLVWLSDGWHLFDFLYMTAQQLPFCIMTVHHLITGFKASGWWYLLILPLLGLVKLVHGVIFEHWYKKDGQES